MVQLVGVDEHQRGDCVDLEVVHKIRGLIAVDIKELEMGERGRHS